jgi:TonB family protein
LKALVLSLLLHLLILLLFTTNFEKMKFLPPHAQEKKISLNLQQMVTPPPAPKPKVIPQPIVSPPIVEPIVQKVVKPKVEKQENKKVLLDESKKTFATKSTEENNVTKVLKKPLKKPVKKIVKKETKKITKKKIVKKKIRKKKTVKKKRVVKRRKIKRSKDPLANMLMGSGSSMYPSKPKRTSGTGNYGAKMIKQLYGSEFNTFSPAQKNYIRNNLSAISRITQRTLTRNGYPHVAIRTKQQGTNVVSFYLHPNGDISGLRLKRKLGYAALDQNTIKVIRLAYKDYPLPNKKTKIVFYVHYNLY